MEDCDIEAFRDEIDAFEAEIDHIRNQGLAKDKVIDCQEDLIGGLKVHIANIKSQLENAQKSDSVKKKDVLIQELLTALTHQTDFRNYIPRSESIKKFLEKKVDSLITEKGTYHGDLVGGVANGQGRIVFNNGQTYQGEWLNNRIQGKGKYTWPGSRVYQGEFKNGFMDGFGKYFYPSGDIYEGYFKNGIKNGFGTYTYANGNIMYAMYKAGEYEGPNIQMTADKEALSVKQYKDGKLHGSNATYQISGTIKDYLEGTLIPK